MNYFNLVLDIIVVYEVVITLTLPIDDRITKYIRASDSDQSSTALFNCRTRACALGDLSLSVESGGCGVNSQSSLVT